MLTGRRGRSAAQDEGFTLIELLVAMVVATVLLSLVVGVVTTTFGSSKKIQAHVSVVRDVQLAMDRVSRDVRVANPVTAASAAAMTVKVQRAAACSLVTYAVTTSGATATLSGYSATGNAFTASTATCAAPTVVTSTTILLRAVPTTASPFTFTNKDGTAIGPTFATQTDLNAITRVVITLQGVDNSNRVQAMTTAVDVRNASS